MTAVRIAELHDRLRRLLTGTVLDPTDAERLADYFTDAEMSGRTTHGLQRLPGLLRALDELDGPPRPIATRRGPSTWSVQANGAPGLLAAQQAVELVLDPAAPAASVVGVTGFSGTTGALGYFTEQVARAGRLAVCIVACESGVAPAGGIDPLLGTNPLAISFPSADDPVTIDISTSAVSYGTLQLLAGAGLPAPEGSVLDSDGRPSLDPLAADSGAQLPMAAHKGYGLALMIELVAGVMIGAKAGRVALPGADGLVLMAAPVDLFRPADMVAEGTARLLDEIRQSRPSGTQQKVRTPGQRSAEARRAAGSSGHAEVDQGLWQDLVSRTSEA